MTCWSLSIYTVRLIGESTYSVIDSNTFRTARMSHLPIRVHLPSNPNSMTISPLISTAQHHPLRTVQPRALLTLLRRDVLIRPGISPDNIKPGPVSIASPPHTSLPSPSPTSERSPIIRILRRTFIPQFPHNTSQRTMLPTNQYIPSTGIPLHRVPHTTRVIALTRRVNS